VPVQNPQKYRFVIRNRVSLPCNHSAIHSPGGLMRMFRDWEQGPIRGKVSNFQVKQLLAARPCPWLKWKWKWQPRNNKTKQKVNRISAEIFDGGANIIDPRCSYLACSRRVQWSDDSPASDRKRHVPTLDEATLPWTH